MTPESSDATPLLEYLLKEVSFSTCDNRFFGELEREMLIPNNINIHGKIQGATGLKNHKLRVEFPEETVIGYMKNPISSDLEGKKRVLTYALEDLLNWEDYWWYSLKGETEFHLPLNLLPPFPRLNPLDLQISCRPDVAVGLETSVTTQVRLQAEEHIDKMSLKFTAPVMPAPGVAMAITAFSDDDRTDPRQVVVYPRKEFPFPSVSLDKGESHEYELTTSIRANPSNMQFIRCQQDILGTRFLLLSNTSPQDLPCGVSVIDAKEEPIPIVKATKATVLSATAQVMYSPYSMRPEDIPRPKTPVIEAPAV